MTLHFISMLDQETATLIRRVFPYTVFSTTDLSKAATLIDCSVPPLSIRQQLDLERCGFCSRDGGLKTSYDFNAEGKAIIPLKNNLGFVVEGDANCQISFKTLLPSRAGFDLFTITDSISDLQKLADVALAK